VGGLHDETLQKLLITFFFCGCWKKNETNIYYTGKLVDKYMERGKSTFAIKVMMCGKHCP
jgi:hypothetical protein